MDTPLKFYLVKQTNPFDKPFYRAYGQLTIEESLSKGNNPIGDTRILAYDNSEEYNAEMIRLLMAGFEVIAQRFHTAKHDWELVKEIVDEYGLECISGVYWRKSTHKINRNGKVLVAKSDYELLRIHRDLIRTQSKVSEYLLWNDDANFLE